MAFIYDLADTWNDAGTTFTAIKMDVTDTASASGSLLMDLQVGGSSKFSIGKNADINTSGNAIRASGTRLEVICSNLPVVNFSIAAQSVGAISGAYFGWSSSTTAPEGPHDLRLYRDAAGTLAQRNSTNAQTFNLYNTYTDASNYERGFMKWNSNVLEIGAEAAGTGTDRFVRIKSSLTNGILFAASGNDKAQLSTNSFFPSTDNGITLGQASKGWGNTYISGSIIVFSSLPTADPVNAGQLWNDSGTLKVSAG